ncbi:hypothetical protein [Streptomyces sp. NPDC002845]
MAELLAITAVVAAYFIGKAVQFAHDAKIAMGEQRCCCGRHGKH